MRTGLRRTASGGKKMAVNEKAEAEIPCYFGFTTQKEWRKYIQDLLEHYDRAVVKAVVRIYQLQTDDEQNVRRSNVINGIGFSKNDAEFLSLVAEAFIAGRQVDKRTFEITRCKIKRYWKQLMKLSKAGLEDKLIQIKQRIAEREAEEVLDAGVVADNECDIDSCDSGCAGENPEDYLFPELFFKAEEDPPSNYPPHCRCHGDGLEYLG